MFGSVGRPTVNVITDSRSISTDLLDGRTLIGMWANRPTRGMSVRWPFWCLRDVHRGMRTE
jgi:hypothetical protein